MSFKIAVAPASTGAGASFVSSLIASGLAQRASCSLIETSVPYFYESLSFEKHFLSREFSAFADKIRNSESLRGFANLDGGVDWWLRLPGDFRPFTPPELFRLLYSPKADFAVFDCSGMEESILADFLAEADASFLVVDPMPSKLLSSVVRISKLLVSLPEIKVIVNKMNSGVRRKELDRFLGSKDYLEIRMEDSSVMYKAEYAGRLPWEVSKLPDLQKTQDMLIKQFT